MSANKNSKLLKISVKLRDREREEKRRKYEELVRKSEERIKEKQQKLQDIADEMKQK